MPGQYESHTIRVRLAHCFHNQEPIAGFADVHVRNENIELSRLNFSQCGCYRANAGYVEGVLPQYRRAGFPNGRFIIHKQNSDVHWRSVHRSPPRWLHRAMFYALD